MLGQKIQGLLNDEVQQKNNNLETIIEVQNVRSFFNIIKVFTRKISEGTRTLEEDKDGNVFIATSKEIFGKNYYGKLLSVATKVDLIEFLEETRIPVSEITEEIKQWLAENNIKNIYVHFQHDENGLESWNSYWIKLK